ncbi:MAG TPA: HAMP domain-containing sensor histidine kinase [Pyrinomonadaceae bacterium]|nr:HAMP domain-containing sensor histidine kinase [Pyrinomonadaceae bacterium]
MKSNRRAFLGGNTRLRLVLTLGLAVVLPALTLIYVSFNHVKSIKRDKKVEALIHRDFQYLLYAGVKTMNGKAYALTEEARDLFPADTDSEEEKRRKLKLILQSRPWFDHVFLFDSKATKEEKKAAIVEVQPGKENELKSYGDMYAGWFSMEGSYLAEQIERKPKPIIWFAGEGHETEARRYTTEAIFTVPKMPSTKERLVLGGARFDADYLKNKFFPEFLKEFTSRKFEEDQGAPMFHELTPREVNEDKDRRLVMKIYPGDAQKSEPDRPLAISAGWGNGKPEVSQTLDDPFRGLAMAIRFQGTTAEAIGNRFVKESILILGVLSVLMVGGLVLTYRSVNKQVALARLKSDFVSNVSHELRTPLALIRLYAETLELGRITTQEKKLEYYSIIRKESERLTALINNILDFSRIEAGRKEYDFRETDIAELVRNTLDSYRYQIEQQGFALDEQIDESIPPVRVDREAIARALVNLVNNALKYSDRDKFLGVKLYRANSDLKLEVVDRGIGIDRNDQARIFEKFYRTGDPLVHNTKGSGLGLSLVQHITHAHGGHVEVDSAPGRGSKFTMTLPLEGPQPGTSAA